jgi:hypothetical protein
VRLLEDAGDHTYNVNDTNESKDVSLTGRRMRWFKKSYWLQAVLSFFGSFVLGYVSGFFWSGFNAEKVQSSDVDIDTQYRRIFAEEKTGAFQWAMASGLSGLALYGAVFIFTRKAS